MSAGRFAYGNPTPPRPPVDEGQLLALANVALAEERRAREVAEMELREGVILVRLMHDPASEGIYCACSVCDWLGRQS